MKIMNIRFGKKTFIVLIMVSATLSGCALFKKNCDCPPVGKKRAAINQTAPHS
jgi:hypothetical protein